ncbi:MAG: NADase-type glycan-binding domain-containing protein [Actinomycetota bacterium]
MPDEIPPATPERCPNCAAELAPPGRFCTSCGTAVEVTAGPSGAVDAGSPATADAAATSPGTAADPAALATSAAGGAVVGTAAAPGAAPSPAPPPPASGRGASRVCSSCGAVNARTRELCLACGLDLDPADRTAVPPRVPTSRADPAQRGGWRRRRLVRVLVALAAVAAVVGVITLGLALAELGPFAVEQSPLTRLGFPSERYPELPEVLELSGVATLTSAPPADDRVFAPDRMVDGDPTTAWRAEIAARPPDTDETIDVLLAAPAWVTALAVSNGDHHDAAAYEASGRTQRAELRFDGDVLIGATLLDLGRQRQLIALDEPVLTTAVRLSLVEVLPGVRFEAPALSSIEVRGHEADAADAEVARERAERRPASGPLVSPAPADARPVLPWARDDQGS